MSRKFIASMCILSLCFLFIFFLSKQALLLSILLILIAYAKHRIYPIKKELLWFVFISVGGAIVEIILVNFSNAWSYSYPDIFGIPIWIPIFWGVIGTTIVVLYDGVINKTPSK